MISESVFCFCNHRSMARKTPDGCGRAGCSSGGEVNGVLVGELLLAVTVMVVVISGLYIFLVWVRVT